MAKNDRETGVVTKWIDERGFGFIARDNGRGEIFVHVTAVEDKRPLSEGQRVEFGTATGKKGLNAIDVSPA